MKDLVSYNFSRAKLEFCYCSTMIDFQTVGTSVNWNGRNQAVTAKSESLIGQSSSWFNFQKAWSFERRSLKRGFTGIYIDLLWKRSLEGSVKVASALDMSRYINRQAPTSNLAHYWLNQEILSIAIFIACCKIDFTEVSEAGFLDKTNKTVFINSSCCPGVFQQITERSQKENHVRTNCTKCSM